MTMYCFCFHPYSFDKFLKYIDIFLTQYAIQVVVDFLRGFLGSSFGILYVQDSPTNWLLMQLDGTSFTIFFHFFHLRQGTFQLHCTDAG